MTDIYDFSFTKVYRKLGSKSVWNHNSNLIRRVTKVCLQFFQKKLELLSESEKEFSACKSLSSYNFWIGVLKALKIPNFFSFPNHFFLLIYFRENNSKILQCIISSTTFVWSFFQKQLDSKLYFIKVTSCL